MNKGLKWVIGIGLAGLLAAFLFTDIRFFVFGTSGQLKKILQSSPAVSSHGECSAGKMPVWNLAGLRESDLQLASGGTRIHLRSAAVDYYSTLRFIEEHGVGETLQNNGEVDSRDDCSLLVTLSFFSRETPEGFAIASPFDLQKVPTGFWSDLSVPPKQEFMPQNECVYFAVGSQKWKGKIRGVSFVGEKLDNLSMEVEFEVFPNASDFRQAIIEGDTEEIEVIVESPYLYEYCVGGLLGRAMR